jgi:hypothetical protein
MFLTVSNFAVALCATKILSAYATLHIANLSPEILPGPLALIQNEFATLRGKTAIRNSLPSSLALQTIKGLDGYMIIANFPDKTCTSSDFSLSTVLNTCIRRVSGTYEFISASATVANTTDYADSACTIPKKSSYKKEPGEDLSDLSPDNCIENPLFEGYYKKYYGASGDLTTTRPVLKRR